MKKSTLTVIIIVLAVIGVFFAVSKQKAPANQVPLPIEEMKDYSSSVFKIQFKYPAYYHLEERELGGANMGHHQIILTEDTEENKAVREGNAPGREGPIAITIDIYQNNLDRQTAENFIKGTNDSNYKLGNGELSSTTKGTLSGLEYAWSGLYEAKSLVVSRPSYVYMFSVTRLDPRDRIIADFEGILQTATIK